MTSGGSGKKTFFINSLIHAREWISGATVNKIIEHVSTFNARLCFHCFSINAHAFW